MWSAGPSPCSTGSAMPSSRPDVRQQAKCVLIGMKRRKLMRNHRSAAPSRPPPRPCCLFAARTHPVLAYFEVLLAFAALSAPGPLLFGGFLVLALVRHAHLEKAGLALRSVDLVVLDRPVYDVQDANTCAQQQDSCDHFFHLGDGKEGPCHTTTNNRLNFAKIHLRS